MIEKHAGRIQDLGDNIQMVYQKVVSSFDCKQYKYNNMLQAYEFIGMFMAIPVISSILLTLRICWKLGRKIIVLATYNLESCPLMNLLHSPRE